MYMQASAKNMARTIVAFLAVLLTSLVSAQTLEPNRQAAVMSVINMLLLDERKPPIDQPDGFGVILQVGELSPDTYTVNENLYAQFDLQDEDVELCFFITSATPIQAGDLRLEVNGEAVNVALGENCYSLPRHLQREVNFVNLIVDNASVSLTLTTLELSASNQSN